MVGCPKPMSPAWPLSETAASGGIELLFRWSQFQCARIEVERAAAGLKTLYVFQHSRCSQVRQYSHLPLPDLRHHRHDLLFWCLQEPQLRVAIFHASRQLTCREVRTLVCEGRRPGQLDSNNRGLSCVRSIPVGQALRPRRAGSQPAAD